MLEYSKYHQLYSWRDYILGMLMDNKAICLHTLMCGLLSNIDLTNNGSCDQVK